MSSQARLLKEYFQRSSLVTFGVSGFLLGVAFMSPWLWWVGLFGIALFISAARSASFSKVILGSIFLGAIQFLFVLSWLWSAYPVSWLELSPAVTILLIGCVWFVASLSLGVVKIIPGLFVYYVQRRAREGYIYVSLFSGFPMAWVFAEVLGSGLFSFVHIAAGGGLSLDFGMGYIGYLVAQHGVLIQLASMGGVYVLSLCYIFIGTLLAYLLQQKKHTLLWVLIIFIMAGSMVPYYNSYQDDTLSVAALSTNYQSYWSLSTSEQLQRQEQLMQKTEIALQSGVDYVILPEDAQLSRAFDSPEAVFTFLEYYSSNDVVLVDSGTKVNKDGTTEVKADIYDTKTRSHTVQYKEYLVPTGEYLPALHTWILTRIGFSEAIKTFLSIYNTRPVKNDYALDERTPGVLFCFDSVSPYTQRQLAKESSLPFMVHVVSHSWFTDPWLLQHLLDQQMKVNTLFAKTTVYQASNKYESLRY